MTADQGDEAALAADKDDEAALAADKSDEAALAAGDGRRPSAEARGGGAAAGCAPAVGFRFLPAVLDRASQEALLRDVLAAVDESGWFTPTMPRSGRAFSIEMCSLGPLGWMSDRSCYCYQPHHPLTGRPWPSIPASILALWSDVAGWPAPPECCLVNRYRGGAKLGLHRDEDEEDLTAPVVSISLGDEAVFRLGGAARSDPTRSMRLASGDIVILGGAARLAFHGIDRIRPGSSTLVPGGGRINVTLRKVTKDVL